MSHIVTIKTQLRDPVALAAACLRLGHSPLVQGTAQFYSESATGWIFQLPDWLYPVVVQPESGEAHYDNYGAIQPGWTSCSRPTPWRRPGLEPGGRVIASLNSCWSMRSCGTGRRAAA